MNRTTSNPVLVEVWRGDTLESQHRGSLCVIGSKGEILFSLGDVHAPTFPRSAMKFLQHLPLIESGACEKYNITDRELAVMCGSHNAESHHIAVVHNILRKADLLPEQLACGAHYPMRESDSIAMHRNDEKPIDIHNNCSGKHAGFLLLCVHMGWDTKNYLHPDHPSQQWIKRVCAEMYEYDIDKMSYAVDGCSAPNYPVPVYHQALAYKNLSDAARFGSARETACRRIIEAVQKHAFMVAGTGRYCTEMMEHYGHEIVGKVGAEGVYCMSFHKKKIGVCIKIDDGKMLPQYNVAQSLIEACGLFDAAALEPMHRYVEVTQKNWKGIETGVIRTTKNIFSGMPPF